MIMNWVQGSADRRRKLYEFWGGQVFLNHAQGIGFFLRQLHSILPFLAAFGRSFLLPEILIVRKSCENHVGEQERHALSPRNTTDVCNFYRAKIVRTVYSIYFLVALWAVFFVARGGRFC